jgi:hypothetical protein
MRSDTAAGDRSVRLHHRPAFEEDEGTTLQEIAESMGVDVETAMYGLLDAGCAGFVETDLARWRPRDDDDADS